MMSFNRVRELMEDPDLSDADAAALRDAAFAMAGLALEAWEEEVRRASDTHLTSGEEHAGMDERSKQN